MNILSFRQMSIRKINICLLFFFLIIQHIVFAQERVTMQECQQWAIEQSSANSQIKDLEHLHKIKHQLIKSYIPEVNFNASVGYQSHTFPSIQSTAGSTFLDFDNPVNRDHYLLSLDLTQKVWDGGMAKSKQKYEDITSGIALQNIHIKTYEFKEEIGKMFLMVLYLEENNKVIASSMLTLKEDLKKLEALYENGIILESNVFILEAEIMRIEQEKERIELQLLSLRSALSEFTKKDLSNAEFVFIETLSADTSLHSIRPEFTLFKLQRDVLDCQKNILFGQTMPKIHVFASGGYGRPTYNLMNNNFDFMYIVGAKLHVPITSWGATKNGKDYLEIQKNLVRSQENDYEQGLKVRMMEKLSEMKNLENLIDRDETLIRKRQIIVDVCKKQLEQGVITASDYIKELNALNEVVLNKQLHKIQLEQAKMNYNSLKGIL